MSFGRKLFGKLVVEVKNWRAWLQLCDNGEYLSLKLLKEPDLGIDALGNAMAAVFSWLCIHFVL